MPNVSRLARGYVRQELRPLKKTNGVKVGLDFLLSLRPLYEQYTSRNKRLPEQSPQNIVDSMNRDYLPQLLTIGGMPGNLEFQGLRAKTSKQVNALYWEANEHHLSDVRSPEKTFDDQTVDLRFIRLCADRKRVILDDAAVPISISEHALGRMSERGYNVETPLAQLSGELSSWLPLSFAYLFVGMHLKRVFGMAIPVGDGFLLGSVIGQTVTKTPETKGWMLTRRSILDNRGFHVTEPPRHDFFKIGEESSIILRLNTFISGKQLKWEQEWARDRLLAIMDKHQAIMPLVTEMIIEGRIMDLDIIEGVKGLLVDLIVLIEDDVWEDAIRIAS